MNKATTDIGWIYSALHIAAFFGHERTVAQLLKAGADVNKARTDVGFTPLYMAAVHGHEGVVEQLLRARADVNKASTDDGCHTPLYVAAGEGHEGVVIQLLKAGADPSAERTSGTSRTSLRVASFDGMSQRDLLTPSRGWSKRQWCVRRSPRPEDCSDRRPSGGGPGLDGAWSVAQR